MLREKVKLGNLAEWDCDWLAVLYEPILASDIGDDNRRELHQVSLLRGLGILFISRWVTKQLLKFILFEEIHPVGLVEVIDLDGIHLVDAYHFFKSEVKTMKWPV